MPGGKVVDERMSLASVQSIFARCARVLPAPAKRLARRGLRAVALAGLRARARPLPVASGPLLVFSPHPDDDVLGCGGLALRHRRAGGRVFIVYLTDGDASHPGHPALPPELLARTRRAEAARAADVLGVPASDLLFLGLPDGCLPMLPEDLRARAEAEIADLLLRVAPAAVLMPMKEDGSSEHAAAHALATRALRAAGLSGPVLEYPVWALWQPARLLPLWRGSGRIYRHRFPEDREAKARAIAAHATQFAPTPPWPKPVLPEDFAASFSPEEEFFFEVIP